MSTPLVRCHLLHKASDGGGPRADRTATVVVEVVAVRATDAVGRYGERVAARLLTDHGLEVIDRNWRCPAGEIDLVAIDRASDEIVFVEVKTRRSTTYGAPAEAVTRAKLARMRRLAALWLRAHDRHAENMRVDVIAVLARASGPALVEHLRAVG